jgi:hypothetical protein
MTARLPRLLAAALLAIPLATGLAACGKKGQPKPPEGQESAYTYPQPYPAPKTVVPGAEDESSQDSDPFAIFSGNRRSRTTTFE